MKLNKNVLITGASSGIGEQIAKNLSKMGYNLFLSGRKKLDNNNYLSLDISSYSACKTLYNSAKEYFKNDIDILINCAGQYIYKPIEKMKEDEINNLIDIEGIGKVKAIELLSAIELGRRVYESNDYNEMISLVEPEYIVNYFNYLFKVSKAVSTMFFISKLFSSPLCFDRM